MTTGQVVAFFISQAVIIGVVVISRSDSGYRDLKKEMVRLFELIEKRQTIDQCRDYHDKHQIDHNKIDKKLEKIK